MNWFWIDSPPPPLFYGREGVPWNQCSLTEVPIVFYRRPHHLWEQHLFRSIQFRKQIRKIMMHGLKQLSFEFVLVHIGMLKLFFSANILFMDLIVTLNELLITQFTKWLWETYQVETYRLGIWNIFLNFFNDVGFFKLLWPISPVPDPWKQNCITDLNSMVWIRNTTDYKNS